MKLSPINRLIIVGLAAALIVVGYDRINGSFHYVRGSTVRNTLLSAGEKRSFLLHVPASYKSGDALPVVLNFHGFDSNAAQQEQISEMSSLADSAGFIVVYPEGTGNPQAWQIGPEGLREIDKIFVQDILQQLEMKLSVDPNRVFASGISNGAQMAVRLGCEMADRFAAIAIISGSFPSSESCTPMRFLPLIAFHGTADKSLPFKGGGLAGGYLMPARDGAVKWAKRNGCADSSAVIYHKGDVTGEIWSDCHENANVAFYTIQDGGHTWPGSNTAGSGTALLYDSATHDINASTAIWEFFKSRSIP